MKITSKKLFLVLLMSLLTLSCAADEIDELLTEIENFYNKNDLPELIAQMKAGDEAHKIEATAILTRYFSVMERLEENEDVMSVNQLKRYLTISNSVMENFGLILMAYSLVDDPLLNEREGTAEIVLDPTSEYIVGTRPQFSIFNLIGQIRTSTKDTIPYVVIVDMLIEYDLNNNAAQAELTSKLNELRDFVQNYFRGKMASELVPESEEKLKQEIREILNNRILDVARVRGILFNKLDVVGM